MVECSISVCMPVGNKAEFIEKSLRSIYKHADEIIILDTGSADGSMDIAKKYADKIFSCKFKNDFSRIRNEAAKHASKEWIFSFDPDMILVNGKNLGKCIPPNKFDILKIKCVDYFEEGKQREYFLANRLFRNNGKYQFYGLAHEDLAEGGSEEDLRQKDAVLGFDHGFKSHLVALAKGICIKHYGDFSLQRRLEKNRNDRKWLLSDIKKHPNRISAYYYLARTYYNEALVAAGENAGKISLHAGNSLRKAVKLCDSRVPSGSTILDRRFLEISTQSKLLLLFKGNKILEDTLNNA